jgi:hypothetical protein
VHHELVFLRTHTCLSVHASQMPYGKNKRLSAPRPKKKKVEAREDAVHEAITSNDPNEHIEDGQTLACAAPAPASDATLAPSPGRAKRQAAEVELDELRISFLLDEELNADAERELNMHERLYEAKMKRVDDAQKRKKQRGCPIRQMERIYQAEVDVLRARLHAAETEATMHNAEANLLAQQCRVLRLESAKHVRSVRKLGGKP